MEASVYIKAAAVLVACLTVAMQTSAAPPKFGPNYEKTKGEIWPRPFHQVKGKTMFEYDPSRLEFKGLGEKCPLISETVLRYRQILNRQSRGPLSEHGRYTPRGPPDNTTYPELKVVLIKHFGQCEIYPSLQMDESYRIDVVVNDNGGEATIQSNSVWGIMRGLESFSQISYFDGKVHKLKIRETHIWDKPRFPHRGLMIDTSRHYLQKRTIKLMLEAMEYNKYNVLHWHVTDDQSFPYESKMFPQLSERGAYNPDKIYTERDIREIIEFARLRGIRVMPEFDTPGHTQSWGIGKPDLLAKCYDGPTPNGLYGPVDPSNEANYDFLEKLFHEITHIFPESHFHFGGDEVDFSCWRSNPNITEFMEKQGIAHDYEQLESLYIKRVLEIADKLKVTPIVWQEVFLNDRSLSNETIVHIWTGNMKTLLSQTTQAGMNVLLSTCWYLDHFGQDLYGGGGDWQGFYNCEPLDFPGTDEMKSRVLGGEACMWGEVVDDTNIVQRVWPRACSAAERLWSSQFDVTLAINRIEEHVCRMRSRGILAQPPNGPSTC